MSTDQTFVIVGGSLAGAKAAETLRTEGFDGRLVIVDAGHERPYERPPLSKDYLRGESEREKIYVHPQPFYADHDIELRLGAAAVSLDAATRRVAVDGEQLRYDRLLLATGAEPRRLTLPGSDLDGVLYLRTVEDSDALSRRLDLGGRLVVVGAGWIGSEVAASARQRGLDVTVVDPLTVPLERVLGRDLGRVYRELHAEHGVRMLMESGVTAFEGDGRVERVRISDGRAIDCDAVVVGVGARPRSDLAAQAGIAVSDGVDADRQLRTSAPEVFVAGDVARAEHPFYGRPIRVEHWANALNQGPVAARNMLGREEPYDRLPYFFSDQYDVGMEYVGDAGDADQVVVRGDTGAREFIAFWLREGRVVAGMNVNVWDVSESIEGLIRSRAVIDRAALADPDVTLVQLAETHRAATS